MSGMTLGQARTRHEELAAKIRDFQPLLEGNRNWIAKGSIDVNGVEAPAFFVFRIKQEEKGTPPQNILYELSVRILFNGTKQGNGAFAGVQIARIRKQADQYYAIGSLWGEGVSPNYSHIAVGIPYQGNAVGKIQLLKARNNNWIDAPAVHWQRVSDEIAERFEQEEDAEAL